MSKIAAFDGKNLINVKVFAHGNKVSHLEKKFKLVEN